MCKHIPDASNLDFGDNPSYVHYYWGLYQMGLGIVRHYPRLGNTVVLLEIAPMDVANYKELEGCKQVLLVHNEDFSVIVGEAL